MLSVNEEVQGRSAPALAHSGVDENLRPLYRSLLNLLGKGRQFSGLKNSRPGLGEFDFEPDRPRGKDFRVKVITILLDVQKIAGGLIREVEEKISLGVGHNGAAINTNSRTL